MKLHIQHTLRYQYDRPVFFDPLTLRLRPQTQAFVNVLDYQRQIDPIPAGLCGQHDAFDNHAELAWFDGEHDHLHIALEATVETTLINPFGFFITDPAATQLPLNELPTLAMVPAVYRRTVEVGSAVAAFAQQVADQADGRTQGFLSSLADRIHRDFQTVHREAGPTWPAEQTLERGAGACRDFAVLFIAACRSQGIPARFVSGYGWASDESVENELHAWAEVFLPGPGWHGYDPTLGLAVADAHVPVARAPEPAAAAPTQGTYRGSDIASRMQYQVQVTAAP